MHIPRYDVYRQHHGPRHYQEKLNCRPVRFVRAKAMADADPDHVRVYLASGGSAVYDNRKGPAARPFLSTS